MRSTGKTLATPTKSEPESGEWASPPGIPILITVPARTRRLVPSGTGQLLLERGLCLALRVSSGWKILGRLRDSYKPRTLFYFSDGKNVSVFNRTWAKAKVTFYPEQ